MAQDNPRISLKLERFDLDSEDDLLEPALDAPIITRISGAEISNFSLTLLADLEPGKYALSAIGIPSHDPAPSTFYITAS